MVHHREIRSQGHRQAYLKHEGCEASANAVVMNLIFANRIQVVGVSVLRLRRFDQCHKLNIFFIPLKPFYSFTFLIFTILFKGTIIRVAAFKVSVNIRLKKYFIAAALKHFCLSSYLPT